MGSNSKPGRVEVVIKDRGVDGGGGGQQQRKKPENDCLFGVRFSYEISSGNQIKAGDFASLTPAPAGDGLDVYVNGRREGPYSGNRSEKILSCIGRKFVFEGRVLAVGPDSMVEIEVESNER